MENQTPKIQRTAKFKSLRSPIPYTQSNVEPPLRTLNGRSRNINAKVPPQPASTTWLQVESQARGTDPTAPHLKYGVFPQKRPSPRGVAIRTLNAKPVEAQAILSDYSSGKNERKKTPKECLLAEVPLFVFRNIDKSQTRHLSVSEILHVDIKPQRNPPMSPTRNCSPPYNNMSPSLSKTSRSLRRACYLSIPVPRHSAASLDPAMPTISLHDRFFFYTKPSRSHFNYASMPFANESIGVSRQRGFSFGLVSAEYALIKTPVSLLTELRPE